MAVISLRQALADQDLIAAALQPAKRALSESIRASGKYAVEVTAADLAALQQALERLSEEADRANQAGDFDLLCASLRGELRTYRDKTARDLARMRADVEAAMAAMQNLADAVASSGSGHERRLNEELEHLEQAAQADDFAGLRAAVSQATQAIRASCEEVLQANALTIAQLRDEIRILHGEVERERRSQWIDRATGGWNRLKADTKIKDLIRLNQPFCVLLAGLNQLEITDGDTPSSVWRDDALRCMLSRIENISGEDALIARWSEDVFAVVIDVPRGALPVTADRLQGHVSTTYPVQVGSHTYNIRAAAKVALVERTKGMDESQLYPRLGQAAFAVIAG